MTPGSMPLATELFQEGLIIPPLKLYSRGRMDRAVFDLILSNVRTPTSGGRPSGPDRGQRDRPVRLEEAVARFGAAKVRLYSAIIQDYTEGFLRETIKAIPDGTYAFEDFLDDDGISTGPSRSAFA